MPAGVGWGSYLRFMAASLLAMFAGAQTVHIYYNPLKDLDQYIETEKLHIEQLSRSFEEQQAMSQKGTKEDK